MTFLLNLITAAVLYGTPLLYGTSGEILTEKSGNLNLGVEGMMLMGGALGLGAAFYYEKLAGAAVSAPLAVVIAIAASFLAGALAALLFSFLTITLRANQNVTGPVSYTHLDVYKRQIRAQPTLTASMEAVRSIWE